MTKAELLSKYEYHQELADVAAWGEGAQADADIEIEDARAELAFEYAQRADD